MNTLINADNPSGERLWELLNILSEFEPKIKFQNFNFLHNFINDVDDEDTLKDLFDFVDKNNIEDKNILNQIDVLLNKYLRNIADDGLSIDIRNYISTSYDDYSDIEVDINGIEREIRDTLDSFLDGFNVNILDRISFDTSDIVSSINVDSMVNSFLENYEPDYDRDSHQGYFSNNSGGDDIDAIFERL